MRVCLTRRWLGGHAGEQLAEHQMARELANLQSPHAAARTIFPRRTRLGAADLGADLALAPKGRAVSDSWTGSL